MAPETLRTRPLIALGILAGFAVPSPIVAQQPKARPGSISDLLRRAAVIAKVEALGAPKFGGRVPTVRVRVVRVFKGDVDLRGKDLTIEGNPDSGHTSWVLRGVFGVEYLGYMGAAPRSAPWLVSLVLAKDAKDAKGTGALRFRNLLGIGIMATRVSKKSPPELVSRSW